MMHAILIWFDRLPYGLLGCCGNTSGTTSGFNRLAAECVTFDRCYATDLKDDGSAEIAQLLVDLAHRGIRVRVVTQGSTRLGEFLRRMPNAKSGAMEISLRASIDDHAITEIVAPHCDAGGCESRLTVLSLVGVPPDVVDWRSDGVASAIAHADDVVDRLVADLRKARTVEDLLVLVTAAVGLAVAGPSDVSRTDPLKEWAIRVPMFGRIGPALQFGVRCSSLVSNEDGLATVSGYFGHTASRPSVRDLGEDLRGGDAGRRDALLVRGHENMYGLLTDDWYLITELRHGDATEMHELSAESASLFMKPDDLWDQLDVAGQSREVVDRLVSRLIAESDADGMITGTLHPRAESRKIAEDFD